MAYTDKLLSFEFIERKLNVDTKRLRAFRVNRDGTREAWLSDVVREFTPSTRPTGRQAGSVADRCTRPSWWPVACGLPGSVAHGGRQGEP